VEEPPVFAPASLLAAAAAWALTLAFGEPEIGSIAATVAAADLLIVTLVAIIGLVVAKAIWARRFSMVVIGLTGLMALLLPISNYWVIALLLSGLAVVAVTGPYLDDYLQPPETGGPPPKSVVLLLLLLTLPGVTAFLSGSPLSAAAWAVVIGSPIVAWAYGKAMPVGLWAARTAIPALGIAASWGLAWWAIVLLVATMGAEAWLAWSKEVGSAVSGPDRPPGARGLPIPPELAPREVLAAAGLDDHGRRIDDAPGTGNQTEEGDG
jgi:hypothetical protein